MTTPRPPERRAFPFSVTAPGVLEGVLIPYGVALGIDGVFEEVWEPHCLLLNDLQVNVRHDWRRPPERVRGKLFSEFGKGLQASASPARCSTVSPTMSTSWR